MRKCNTSEWLLESAKAFESPVVCILRYNEMPGITLLHIVRLSNDVILIETDDLIMLKLTWGHLILGVLSIEEAVERLDYLEDSGKTTIWEALPAWVFIASEYYR